MPHSCPERGEIWLVDFDPSKGAEINKQRPALVVSSTASGVLPLRIVVPLTSWQSDFEAHSWMFKIAPTKDNGLQNISAADCFQVKSVTTERFVKCIGTAPLHILDEIAATIAIIIEAI